MKLGVYTFPWRPDRFTPPDAYRQISSVDTFTSNVVFEYGNKIIGKQIVVEWEWMSAAQFDALDVLYQANAPLMWDLEVVGQPTFTVEIVKLDGELFDVAHWDLSFRRKVQMTLLIMDTSLVAWS